MFRILFFVLALTTFQAFGQNDLSSSEEDEPKEKLPLGERLYYSGGLGFNANNQLIQISLSPNLGYKFNEVFSMGLGLSYQWIKFRVQDVNTNNFGGKVFARGKLPANILAAAEYEGMSFENFDRTRSLYKAALIGGGYHMKSGGKASINIFLYYNLNYSDRDALYSDQFVPKIEIAYNF